ncbi:MAG: F0F1 ATP synthase subunit epsilon [Sphingomonadales bacterium]
MSETLHFELVSPESLLMEVDTSSVVIPGSEGDFMVLPKHAPLMSTIRPGVISVMEEGSVEPKKIFIRGGFADVTPSGLVVLAEKAIFVEELSQADLEEQIKNAHEDVEDAKSDEELKIAQGELYQLEELLSVL